MKQHKLLITAFLLTIIYPLIVIAQSEDKTDPAKVKEYIETMAKAITEKNDPMRNRMFFKLRIVGADAVEPLINTLQDKRRGVPEYAAFTLGWIADERAVEPLMGMVKLNDINKIRAAMKALGNMQAVKAIPVIAERLKHQKPEVRRDAVYALGLMRDEKSLPHLEPMLNDADEIVVFFTKEAIERVKTGW